MLSRSLRNILCLEDFQEAARKILPRPIYGYIHGGVETEQTVRDNRQAFQEYGFLPRGLVDVSGRDCGITLLGRRYRAPFGIAPMGIAALSTYQGDLALLEGAAASGIPAILSGSALTRLEDVAQRAPGTWFQAYLPGDQNKIDALIERVMQAGFETLVITIDTPVNANRENNLRNGFSTPLRPSLRLALDGVSRPRWLVQTLMRTLLRHGVPHFENAFAQRGAPIISSTVMRDFSHRDHLNWTHLARIRSRWQGKLVIKGILNPGDAQIACAHGVDGLILSNHGGRQLDGAVSPLRVLPRIADKLAGAVPIMMDSGVRRGSDVIKAIGLGACCVFVGRPFNFSAAVAGQAGVEHAAAILRDEVLRCMGMLGLNRLEEMTADLLMPLAPVSASAH